MNYDPCSFRLIHVNIRGFRANRQNLLNYLAEENFPDVITINETKLGVSTDVLMLPNYEIAARREPTMNGGRHGSMILVKNTIKETCEINVIREQFIEEVVGVKVKTSNNYTFNIITYYNPPEKHVNERIFAACKRLRGKTILTGDLNSKNINWGSTFTDPQGDHLQNALIDHRFILLNNGEKTRCDPRNGQEQVLDIAVSNLETMKYFHSFEIGADVGSDHYPLKITLSLSTPVSAQERFRDIKDTNWESYRKEFENVQFSEAKNGHEIDECLSRLNEMILKAFEISCPLKGKRIKGGISFTKEMRDIVKEKRAIRRQKSEAIRLGDSVTLADLQKALNRKNNELKKLQRQKQTEDLRKDCQSLNQEKNSAKFFKLYDKIAGKSKKKDSIYSAISDESGNLAETDQEKANLFASQLEKTHQTSEFSGFNENWRQEVESYVTSKPEIFKSEKENTYDDVEVGDSEPLMKEINAEEVIAQLGKCKNGSAPGEDGINYVLLKRLPKTVLTYIATLFQKAFTLGYFPDSWKRARIKMVAKPNKDEKISKNYRPISLLPCLGKVFERIVANRLSFHMEESKLFSKYQTGYRKGRMTTEHLLRLSEETNSSFKKKEISMSLFLDAESAFDKAWHDAIRYKIHHTLKLPNRLVRLISSFLTERKLSVNVGKSTSREILMKAGTPQGSALSPLLYLILVNDIPETITEHVSLTQFADDIGLWARAYTFYGCLNKLQRGINTLEAWCRRWRIKLNGTKSNFLISHKLHETPPADLAVQLFNDIVRPTESAKFLGVEFDGKMSMSDHTNTVIKNASKRLGIFKLLSFGGIENEIMIQLYKTYVRPLFEYGSISLIHRSSEINRLQQIQNKFIRTSLKIPSYIRTDLIHDSAGLETVQTRLLDLNRKLLGKMAEQDQIKDLIQYRNSIVPLNNYRSPLDMFGTISS